MSAGRIESVRIRGFRSLADVELSGLQNANVLIGANGSGKSNCLWLAGQGKGCQRFDLYNFANYGITMA